MQTRSKGRKEGRKEGKKEKQERGGGSREEGRGIKSSLLNN
jgi:hypothetical protein